MMTLAFDELFNRAEELAEEAISTAQCVAPERLGLDPRAAAALFVGEDFIAVRAGQRRTLDYYGGFEYVDKRCVQEIGGLVFYSDEDDRVRGHLDNLEES